MAAHRIRVLLLLVTTGGCAANQAGPLGLNGMFGNADLAAAEPLFSKDEDRCLDSPVNLIRITQGEQGSSPAGAGFKVSCDEALKEWRIILKDARAKDNDVTKAKLTRNEVVDALLAASNRKCSRYTALIKNADGAVNGGLSVAAILTGGLGSFVGGAAAAKALSGTSAILTGSRTALNETYLSKQTIHVLASAFDKARQRRRAAITNRQACNIEQYTVMRGVEDAIAYHGTCSLVGGLAATAQAVERSDNPGFAEMRMTIYELGKMREQVDAVASTKDVVQTPLGSVTGFDFAQTERLAQAQKVFDRLDEATTAVRTKAEDARKKVEGLTADSAEEERTEAQNDLVSAKSNLLLAERRLSDAYDNLTLALRQRLEARTPPRTNSADVVGLEMRKCPFDADIRGAL